MQESQMPPRDGGDPASATEGQASVSRGPSSGQWVGYRFILCRQRAPLGSENGACHWRACPLHPGCALVAKRALGQLLVCCSPPHGISCVS